MKGKWALYLWPIKKSGERIWNNNCHIKAVFWHGVFQTCPLMKLIYVFVFFIWIYVVWGKDRLQISIYFKGSFKVFQSICCCISPTTQLQIPFPHSLWLESLPLWSPLPSNPLSDKLITVIRVEGFVSSAFVCFLILLCHIPYMTEIIWLLSFSFRLKFIYPFLVLVWGSPTVSQSLLLALYSEVIPGRLWGTKLAWLHSKQAP